MMKIVIFNSLVLHGGVVVLLSCGGYIVQGGPKKYASNFYPYLRQMLTDF